MSEENKAVIKQLIEARNTNDVETFVTLFAGELQNRLRRAFTGISEAFPDVHITADDVIAEGNKVVVRWTFRGTNRGAVRDVPATDKAVVWMGIDMYTVANGKIASYVRVSDILGLMKQDALGLMQQVGAIITPE
jgi:predicted ester cyclase